MKYEQSKNCRSSMTVGSLFSGIGGLDLGLERAGMSIKWQVENDPYCQRVLRKHWPKATAYGDVKTIRWGEEHKVDLVCGGFPCQPVSVAGKQKGADDERWLWPEFRFCISELRPRWVLVENVPGLLSADAGRIFGGILADLARCGFDAAWDCIPASAVGAPHLRYRVFIVAHPAGVRLDEARGGLRTVRPGGQRGTGPVDGSKNVPDADRPGLAERSCFRGHARQELQASERRCCEGGGIWEAEPSVGRVANGVPNRVDRLRCLGNAVVPQVAEYLGRLIMEAT